MTAFRPKYITFDCYGTLTRFRMSDMAREMFADRIPAEAMDQFCKDFNGYRFDEVLGAWKPYAEVLYSAVERTCKRWGISFTDAEANAYYEAVPSWGPHPDVTAGLAKIADKIPLVIYSNAADEQIMSNVDKLGVPFHRVFTAEQGQAYKPRLQAFEYMLDNLGCGPEDVLHVSSSFRYDLIPADYMNIKHKVFVNRGHEPSTPYYSNTEIKDIGGLAAVVGLE
ncbi:haloacid dehalogenase type II [Pseudomonas oryzihabitans]|uniref:haloacid dehalogenase type II n=1 Tax=Pseudomonas oryzihabitans TaxID=47885 RepID=UPI0011A88341|nr:haloacid dehalogenase type II [Pseudomonas psychrotolerans]